MASVTDFVQTVTAPSPNMSTTMQDEHNKLRRSANRLRKMRRGATRMKRTKTNALIGTSRTANRRIRAAPGIRAREIVSGLSPQQINPIKVRLASKETKGFVPAYSVLFNKTAATLECSASGKKPSPLGVMLEDGSEPKNDLAVVTTAGLVPLLCPSQQAEKFQWGDFVGVSCDNKVKFGYADTNPDVALVFPVGEFLDTPTHTRIGKFMGWPTNNPKDGGILVKIDLKKYD